MTKQALIDMLRILPEDADIVVDYPPDDILGYYGYSTTIEAYEDTAFVTEHGHYKAGISNDVDTRKDKKKKVWVLR